LQFEDRSFDVVVASQIIEHIQNTDLFVKEVYRVLKPLGYAIFATPNLAAWYNILYLLLGIQPETATVSEEMYPWKEKPGHLRIFTSTELIKMLKFHNFCIDNILGCTYPPFMGKVAAALATRDWKHCGTIIVKVSKNV
jgi:2-polyprenyl-3-methyl-5-hydroxy-6-metoxy-1,4-benzoquinol methylase